MTAGVIFLYFLSETYFGHNPLLDGRYRHIVGAAEFGVKIHTYLDIEMPVGDISVLF